MLSFVWLWSRHWTVTVELRIAGWVAADHMLHMSLASGYFQVMMERDRKHKWGPQV